MADVVTSTTLLDGERHAIMSFTYQYVDTGNESAVTKVDVSGLAKNSEGESCSAVRIVGVWYSTVGMTVEILSDASTDIIIMHLDEGQSGYQDFSKFGGLPTTSSYGSSGTGDVKFTTTGAGAAGDAYQIVIRGIKQY